MKVDIEKVGPCRRIMHVMAEPDAVASDYEAVAKAYRDAARIPGFRPGKAPVEIVKKRYADKIRADVQDRAVPRLYQEALQAEQIEPVALVAVDDVVCDMRTGMSFKAALDVEPDFKLPKYRKISVKPEPVDVSDQDVEAAFDRFLESHSRFEDVEGRPVRNGDLVQLDYTAVCDGKPVSELVPDDAMVGAGKDFWAIAGEPEFLPGFAAAVEGAALGETRKARIAFPEDFRAAALAGREAEYTFTIKAVRERVPPTVDEAFLKPFGVKDETEMRARVRDGLESQRKQAEQARQREAVVKWLLEKTHVELPEAVVDRERNAILRDAVQRMSTQGMKEADIRSRQAELVTAAEQSSTDRVKLSFILKRIADEEQIDVSDADVDARVNRMAGQYRMQPEALRARMEDRDGLAGLKQEIRSEKTLDFLIENAKTK